MQKVKNCPSCGSNKLKTIKKYSYQNFNNDYSQCKNYIERRLFLLDKIFRLDGDKFSSDCTLCCDCDLLFSNPRLDDRDIQNKYKLLNSFNSTTNEYNKAPITHKEERAKRIFNLLKNHIQSSGSILDLGGQFGYNLKYFENYKKYIVDFEEHKYKDDICYLGSDLSNIENNFDVIISNHTVEHLPYFDDFFNNIVKRLTDNGVLYIEVPLGSLYEAYTMKEPLTHFNFFSEKSLANLLLKYNLYPFYIETKYQHITTSGEYCINILATKHKHKTKMNYRDTKYFKYHILYMLKTIIIKIKNKIFK
jgi:SAM-dependent methyltransferase